ncbi:MAG TPA: serine/threonine-protein kinase [Ktedonobacteraceae bacterium]
MTDHIAQQFGNYRLVRHLGRGAFSDVYLGIHVHLKTPAAIKLLHTELTSSDVEKFRNEARTIARLEHPHIVRVLDFGIEDHTPFFVMVYAPNGTLRQRHPKGSILSLATIVSYVTQIAGALQFAHNQKFIHRDIKPENMLLGRHNEVLLSDFGFVQIAQSSISQSTKEMAGTIPYMAPEQFHGKPRFASDQYSLGIVVYEWLTGDRPFQGSVLEIATQHMINPPPPVRIKNPEVPLEVEEVLLTALAKEPQQRFATVQAFANALQQASNIVYPIASASTISFEEVSELPSIGTQPISAGMTPQVLIQNAQTTFQTDTFEDTYANISSSSNRQLTNEPVVSTTHSQHRLSRRAVLFGLAGVAVGSVVSNGIWMAKSAGLFTSTPSTGLNSITTPILPLPGTTLCTFTGHTGTVYSAAWSPNGYRIASAGTDKMVLVWDAATGGNIHTYKGHKDYVRSVAWSPDGTYIASGGGNYPSVSDVTVQVWEAATGTLFNTFANHTDVISSIAWSPDGSRIASASYDRSVKIWDAFTGSNVLTYPGHSNWVMSAAWSLDGKHIASASHDNTVRVWDATTGQDMLPPLQHTNWVQSVAWSSDGKFIASATGNTQGNGEHLVHVWDATSGKPVYTYRGHKDEIATVAWSPNGKRIASAGGNGTYPSPKGSDTTVHVWDALTGANAMPYSGHSEIVWSVAWSPEGSRIVSASREKTVQVWKAE